MQHENVIKLKEIVTSPGNTWMIKILFSLIFYFIVWFIEPEVSLAGPERDDHGKIGNTWFTPHSEFHFYIFYTCNVIGACCPLQMETSTKAAYIWSLNIWITIWQDYLTVQGWGSLYHKWRYSRLLCFGLLSWVYLVLYVACEIHKLLLLLCL